ncbi:uncharacterized protein GGS22DRAFT_192867 [Annulohypoxylon maeteangense]|uniref:uncharacterized protein n=1 Tax=Annulohypoxylon maeteangense TaxID=1927788 RepID=UPI0020082B78|nr:uncharacterized protein GGS22DRAFT_192867 [Annulohypoxylon maeteangense]KAI0880732.1 hypothetical protein GGS22DRAFT_192867 [Annulohypoxylon maeteangense]
MPWLMVRGFEDFAGDYEVLLGADTTVEVDVVIFCTGYEADHSILPELEMDDYSVLLIRRVADESRDSTADQKEVEEDVSEKLDTDGPFIPDDPCWVSLHVHRPRLGTVVERPRAVESAS